MKRNIKFALVLLLAIILLIPVYGSQRYFDMPMNHWAYHYVENMSESGLISGYPDGSFRPDNEITCGEFIKLLFVCQTGKVLSQPADCWALNYYNQLAEMGIFSKIEVLQSDLDNVITRDTMAYLCANTLKCYGYEEPVNKEKTLSVFYDVNKYSYHSGEIALCYNEGILSGYPDGNFKPKGSLTRAEAVTVISRLTGYLPETSVNDLEFIGVETVKNRDFKVTKYKAISGFRGIEKIKYDESSGIVSVYSKYFQELSLFIDGYLTDPIINVEAETAIADGCIVYYFKSDGRYSKESRVGLAFGEQIREVYYF